MNLSIRQPVAPTASDLHASNEWANATSVGSKTPRSDVDLKLSSPGTAYGRFRDWATTPNAEPPVVSVVIPAYNEAGRILPTIGAIATHLSSGSSTWELIVADDGSTDDTVDLVSGLGLVNARILLADRNRGKGSAVRRGVLAARGTYVLFADADQSTPIEQFERLLAPILLGRADLVVGSRAHLSAQETRKSVGRRVASWGLRRVVRVVSHIDVADTQCGFKLFRRDVAVDLFSRQVIDGFSFDLELLYLASKLRYTTLELPVDWIDAPGSKVDAAKVSVDFLRDLWRIRRNDLLGRYAGSGSGNSSTAQSIAAPRPPYDWGH